MENLVSLTPYAGLIGLGVALVLYLLIVRQPAGTDRMREIADTIHTGAMAFLKREYSILALFVLLVGGLLAWSLNVQTAICFFSGAFCSVLAGVIGMQAATKANVRTTEAARSQGESAALLVAFDGGAFMGHAVASLGLLGLGIFYSFYGD
ncbi:MAG: sodium/proton-translocating pyrophosphatase, partial [Acidobacteria bacterium]|nr:sodium/proton-translocating pyrophosphatase [Acidobacteriota bacterium]